MILHGFSTVLTVICPSVCMCNFSVFFFQSFSHLSFFFFHSNRYVAKSDGNVVALDVRSRTKKIWDHELHDKKVQTVSCSPVSSHYMVTASLDRSVRLWDIRKIGKKKGKPVWTYHDSRSVNSASFDGKDGSSIVTVSQSNFVRLFSDPTSSLSGDHVAPTCSVRHNNNTGRYLTVRVCVCV